MTLDTHPAAFHDLLGLELIEWRDGFARVAIETGPRHANHQITPVSPQPSTISPTLATRPLPPATAHHSGLRVPQCPSDHPVRWSGLILPAAALSIRKLPNAPRRIGMATKKTMIVPCMVTSIL